MSDNDSLPSPGQFYADCGLLFKSRNKTYKNAWTVMPLESLASFLEAKASRVRALIKIGGDIDKIVDDLKDIVNYSYMIYARIYASQNQKTCRNNTY